MQKLRILSLLFVCSLGLMGPTMAQDYPTYTPTPKPKKTPKATVTPTATPTANAASADVKQGPLKMIRTDGKSPNSPVKVTDLTYYDQGYGAQYNSPIRVSATIMNSSPVDEVKRITMSIQIMDGAGGLVTEYKTPVGNLKPGQTFKYEPSLFYNSRGIPLHAEVQIEHEEIPKARPKSK